VEPFHKLTLLNAAKVFVELLLYKPEPAVVVATLSKTFNCVTFTFSTFEVSVKRKTASVLPVVF
jgi:hypothetical protein